MDLCEGNSPVTGEFPSQTPVTRSLDAFLDLHTWTNGWANHRDAGDMGRHCAHYDVTIMQLNVMKTPGNICEIPRETQRCSSQPFCQVIIVPACHLQLDCVGSRPWMREQNTRLDLLLYPLPRRLKCLNKNSSDCQADSMRALKHPHMPRPKSIVINLLARGRFGSNFIGVIFKRIIQKSSVSTCCEIVPRWMLQNLTNENSTFVQVKAWCRQATSHYLRQLWPRFMSLYGRRY